MQEKEWFPKKNEISGDAFCDEGIFFKSKRALIVAVSLQWNDLQPSLPGKTGERRIFGYRFFFRLIATPAISATLTVSRIHAGRSFTSDVLGFSGTGF